MAVFPQKNKENDSSFVTRGLNRNSVARNCAELRYKYSPFALETLSGTFNIWWKKVSQFLCATFIILSLYNNGFIFLYGINL